MNASLAKAVYLFAAPLSQAARTIDALKATKTDAPAPAEAAADVAAGGDE